MGNTLYTKYYKLERLINWDKVDKVNEMLLEGTSPHQVSAWCKARGFDISHPKLYEYRALLQTAIAEKQTVHELLGANGVTFGESLADTISPKQAEKSLSELSVLDKIIDLGFTNAMNGRSDVKFSDALRAIEMKNKLTGGMNLSQVQIDKIRELEQAKFNAVIQVVQKYVPQEKLGELSDAIEQAERTFYEEHDATLLRDYEKQSK